MEVELDNLALKSDHSFQEQNNFLFNCTTAEEAIQKIKPKWAQYDVEKKENMTKLLKCCYGEDITDAIKNLNNSTIQEESLTNPTQSDTENIPVTSEAGENSEIREEEEDIIIKCSLEEMIKEFFKEYVIVWHDPNVNSPVNQRYLDQLKKFCEVKTFTEWDKAAVEILEANTVCHVITSGTNGELLVREIDYSQNVSEIYIFCKDEDYHTNWTQTYHKVSSINTQIQDIIDQLKQSLLKWCKQASLKLNLPAFAPIFNNYDKSQMNNLHRFLNIIPIFKNRLQAKKRLFNVVTNYFFKRESKIDR